MFEISSKKALNPWKSAKSLTEYFFIIILETEQTELVLEPRH